MDFLTLAKDRYSARRHHGRGLQAFRKTYGFQEERRADQGALMRLVTEVYHEAESYHDTNGSV